MLKPLSILPLQGGLIGIERETLRTNPDGTLARTAHPTALGATLTHEAITTDYAETLLELITPPLNHTQAVYDELFALHQFSAQNIGDERLWATSMPCILPENEDDITVAEFGTSNVGKMKHLYRLGLAKRYGKAMQMIAGIHVNYSPPDKLWDALAQQQGCLNTQHFRSETYMGMLRRIQQLGWIICYLFGASCAVDQSFEPAHELLDKFGKRSFFWEHATSLRMSRLGYQNKVDFHVSFNNLNEYIHDLAMAVATPTARFEYIGTHDKQGQWQQISTHILQIENEYYTAGRPKNPIHSGEMPVIALSQRGVRYVELRLLDINPNDPCGISQEQIRFLECFLLYCLLNPVPSLSHADWNELNENRKITTCCGLSENLTLMRLGRPFQAKEWAKEIVTELLPIAEQLDTGLDENPYTHAITQVQQQINENNTLPQQTMCEILYTGDFLDWAYAKTEQHHHTLQQALSSEDTKRFELMAQASLKQKQAKEAEPQPPFADYLKQYFSPLKTLL